MPFRKLAQGEVGTECRFLMTGQEKSREHFFFLVPFRKEDLGRRAVWANAERGPIAHGQVPVFTPVEI